MRRVICIAAVWLGLIGWPGAVASPEENAKMTARGSFDVRLTPQEDASPAGRMVIDKTYRGDVIGSGVGQMISKRTELGTAVYFAIEEFSGSVAGKTGGFTLLHRGHMSGDSQTLEITILEGSGTGELEGISGAMAITRDEDGHRYELQYEL